MMRRFLRTYLITVNVLTLILCVGVPIIQVFVPKYRNENYVMFLMTLLVAVLFLNISYKRLIQRIDLREKREFESKYREYLLKELDLNEKVSDLSNKNRNEDKKTECKQNSVSDQIKRSDKKDILALMLKNNDEITEYFRINKVRQKRLFGFLLYHVS